MSDCHFGVSPVNYPDPDPELFTKETNQDCKSFRLRETLAIHSGYTNNGLATGATKLELSVTYDRELPSIFLRTL